MSILHVSENVFIDKITPTPLTIATRPMIVHNHPLPIALIRGAATIPPIQAKMFLTKLLTAIPVDALRGRNSVNIVVDMAKMIMDPQPKKNNATSWNS